MRIIIDMQGAQTENSFHGIGLYSISFAKAVARNRANHEVILVLNGLFPETIEPIRSAFDKLIPQTNIRVWFTPGAMNESDPKNLIRSRSAKIVREAFIASLKPDIVHVFGLFNGFWDNVASSIHLLGKYAPVSVTVHDLMPEKHQHQWASLTPDYVAHYDRKTSDLRRADLVLASSRSSQEECRQYLGLGAGRVINASTVVDTRFRKISSHLRTASSLLLRFNLKQPFVICIPNPKQPEDLKPFLKTWSSLPPVVQSTHQIAIIGKHGVSESEAPQIPTPHLEIEHNHIKIIESINPDELSEIYSISKLVIIPSWREGLGLITKEVLSCGTAVIGPNTSSMREYAETETALFSTTNFADFENKLLQALTDESYLNLIRHQNTLRECGQSWDEMAKRAIIEWSNLSAKWQLKSRDLHGEFNISLASALAPHLIYMTDDEIDSLSTCIAENDHDSSTKQILIDVSHLVVEDARTGIQRVVRSILVELMRAPPSGFTIEPVYASVDSPYRYAKQYVAGLMGVSFEHENDNVVEAGTGDIFIGLDLQHFVIPAKKKELHHWRNLGVTVWFVVYDLLPISLSDCFLPNVREYHHKWLQTIAEFDGALCISKAVANEMREWLHNNSPVRHRPFAVEWFHLGADLDASAPTLGWPIEGENFLDSIMSRTSFLMVSTVEPRKGHEQALNAFEDLWERGFNVNLVVVGKQGWQVDDLAQTIRCHPEYGKRLLWLEGISDEFLNEVYAASTCLIVASKGEGFGLPLIEAAQHRLPIIARDLPVFREVAGDHAFYFNGHRGTDIAHAVEHWINLYKKGQHPCSTDMPWLTWKESADQLLRIILPKDGPHTQNRSQIA